MHILYTLLILSVDIMSIYIVIYITNYANPAVQCIGYSTYMHSTIKNPWSHLK